MFFTADPPPKDSDLPPLEGLGLDSKFRSKNFSNKLNESDHFLCISLHLYFHYPQGLGFQYYLYNTTLPSYYNENLQHYGNVDDKVDGKSTYTRNVLINTHKEY